LKIFAWPGQTGVLCITASLGVAASTDGDRHALIADADGALHEAKRAGKNRTVSARARDTDVSGAG
jgi:PleD family two-component response regulator